MTQIDLFTGQPSEDRGCDVDTSYECNAASAVSADECQASFDSIWLEG